VYTNHGKVTTTTLQPSMTSVFFLVTQDEQMIGQQSDRTYEGILTEETADITFAGLCKIAHDEIVEAPGNGKVLAGVIDEDKTP
jgi:hypothetical protein